MPNLPDGVYIHFDSHSQIELMVSDPDALDFYFPNGQFTNKKYELLSYTSEDKKDGDSSLYMLPTSDLPDSETQGQPNLDVQGKCFGNIPPNYKDYVRRSLLEEELTRVLLDDHHPIVTLVGRGGIGKTWLALEVLHKIVESNRFNAVIWFSARDIDLMLEGPKQVKPHVLDENDVADEFARLMNPSISKTKGFKSIDYLKENLTKGALGSLLFVFDNFETVRNPAELYIWLDTYIRLPNKVLITTRFREFKADYHIEVSGMNDNEISELIHKNAINLNILRLLTNEYEEQIIQESEGHPYVAKILIGEVAKSNKLVKVERIVADRDEILKALFERTFNALSPAAKRVFLTLCSWRSLIPQIALEAVLLRPANDRMDVKNAVEELTRSSFIEITEQESEDDIFLSVPLVAMVFGKKKLAVSPLKSAIEADLELLHAFGNVQPIDVKSGIGPRIDRVFHFIAERINKKNEDLTIYLPVLEFLGRKYSPAWLLLASLYEESGVEYRLEKAKEAVQSYLESPGDPETQKYAWKMLQTYCIRTQDYLGEAHAIVEMSQLTGTSFQELSNNANILNHRVKLHQIEIDTYEKEILFSKLLEVIDKKVSEGDATDFSRFAWLALNIQNEKKAEEYTKQGLAIDQSNPYLQSLSSRFNLI